MTLHPSLVDGSLQAGMGANLGENAAEMFVPFSIGEVEILHPLQADCFSYVTETVELTRGKKEHSRVLKTDVLILDQTGKVLVKIRESIGVPLREVHKKTVNGAEASGFSRLYYSYGWEKAPPAVMGAIGDHAGPMLLFDSGEALLDLYRERLGGEQTSDGQIISGQAVLVQPGEAFRYFGDDPYKQTYAINPREKGDFVQLLTHLLERKCAIRNICFAWPATRVDLANQTDVKDALERGVFAFLFLCQAVIQLKLESKVQLLYVYAAIAGESQPHNEAVAAFVNTVHLEHPKLVCKTLEVRQKGADQQQVLNAISAELQIGVQDGWVVRYEEQDRFIKKLAACAVDPGEAPASSEAVLRQRGVVLIRAAREASVSCLPSFWPKNTTQSWCSLGRSELSSASELKLQQMREAGAEVVYVRADVCRREDVSRLIGECKARFGEINGVIHSAGVLRDSLLRNKSADEMTAVFAPKIFGTLSLDELTSDQPLDFFVTFSSLAALAGNAGQCDYSFANHFMDSFAAEREHRRANGARYGRTLSINWSLWADGGMKLDQQTELYFKKTLGIAPLSAATGLDAFVTALASDRCQIAVLEGVQEKVEIAWGLKKKLPAPAAPASPAPASDDNSDPGGRSQRRASSVAARRVI